MNYFLDFDFKNDKLTVLDAYISFLKNTRKRHLKPSCETIIFEKNKYKIVFSGCYYFSSEDKWGRNTQLDFEEFLQKKSIQEIKDIINQKNKTYKCNSILKLFVYNGDDKKEIYHLQRHPLDTIAQSFEHLRDAFLIDTKMEIF